jgi:transposase
LTITLLRARNADVRYVPAAMAAEVAAALNGERKTDARDAVAIAHALRLRPDLLAIAAIDPLQSRLQILTTRRRNLVNERVRIIMRTQALLVAVSPALLKALDLSLLGPVLILTAWQTPTQIREAGPRRIARFLHEHHIPYYAALVNKVMAAAKTQTAHTDHEDAYATAIAELASDLIDLRAGICNLDARIAVTLAEHPLAPIVSSMIGIGPILAAELLGIVGDFSGYTTADRFAAHAGLAPVERDSGTVTGRQRRPKRYHRGLRRVFTQSSLTAIRYCPTSRTYYDRKRAEGRSHRQAIAALSRHRLRVLWAMVHNRETFRARQDKAIQAPAGPVVIRQRTSPEAPVATSS